MVIEKVSGKTYAEMLRERLFEPLGMHDTGLDTDDLILPKRAQGYKPGAKGLEHAVSESMTIPWAAGSMYSTIGDLLRWEQALFGHKVLNEASLKAMTTPGQGGYGLGLFIRPRDGITIIDHGGGIEGFNTSLAYIPERQITIVVLSNVNGTAPDQMSSQLLDLALGKPVTLVSEKQALPIEKAALNKFAGIYQLAPTFAITITVVGDQLTAQATGQPAFPLFYAGDAGGHPRFFPRVVEAELEFVPDTTGAIGSLILHQGGRDLPGKRQ